MQAQNRRLYSDNKAKMRQAIQLNKDLKVKKNKNSFLHNLNLNQIEEEKEGSLSSKSASSEEAEP